MECPFCAEPVKAEAVACKHCSRDLRLVRPVMQEVRTIVAELDHLQRQLDRVNIKLARARFPVRHALSAIAIYAVAPAVLLVAAHIIVTIVLVHRNAQTIGKKLVGIKVARKDGSRASLARIFWLRNVVNALVGMVLLVVPFLGGFYSIIDSLMIFGEQRRCIHDYIADTIVIRA